MSLRLSTRQSISRSSATSNADGDAPALPLASRWQMFNETLRGGRPLDHVSLVLQASLCTNILIVASMTGVVVASGSLALLSAVVENMIDLGVQFLLWYAGTRSRGDSEKARRDYAKYPAGTSRFEPVAIIIASSVMVIVAGYFVQEGISELIDGFLHGEAEAPTISAVALIIGLTAVGIKIGLIFYTRWVLTFTWSGAVDAIQQDNRNDVMSNVIAYVAYIVASFEPDAWFVDPLGAVLIFLFIMFSWGKMGKEQVNQLVGVRASEDFMNDVRELCNSHHHALSLDILRAYHFGSKYLVELEVVVPGGMTVKKAHDIALQLQFKVEQLEDVERAFVHVDYQTRDYDEHVVSREQDALLVYAGLEHGTPASVSQSYSMLGRQSSHPSLPTLDDSTGDVIEDATLKDTAYEKMTDQA